MYTTSTFDKTLINLLNSGAVGVLPSDTVYGLATKADNPAGVERLYAMKSREQNPGTLIAASIEQLEKLGIKHRYLEAVKQYWPNPISVIIPTGDDLKYLHLGRGSLAVRVPSSPKVRELLRQTGPLMTSSANHPGQQPAENLAEARAYFGEEVDFYVDHGDIGHRLPSTIIRVVDDAVEVVRQGAITIDDAGQIRQ